jgi:uncharacterized protein YktA (UPF0223 family)
MAAGRMGTLKEQQEPEEMIEMITFKSNIETEAEPEVSVDNMHERTRIFKIVCVGDCSCKWRKRDYISSDGSTISKELNNEPIYPVDFAVKILQDKSGKEIRIHVWNISIHYRYDFYRIFSKNSCGVIVFWDATSCSIKD